MEMINTFEHYTDSFEPAPTPQAFYDVPFKTVSKAESDPDYYKEL